MPRSRSTHSTSEDRSRRRTLTAMLIVGVVTLVGWIAAISALTGGDGSTEDAERASSNNPVTEGQSPGTTAEPPRTTADETEQDAGSEDGSEGGSSDDGSSEDAASEDAANERAAQDGGGEEPEPTAEDVPVQESPSGDWQQGNAPEGEPAVASGGGQDDSTAKDSDPASDEQPKQTERPDTQQEQQEQQEQPEQQEDMDPLGKNPEPGDLTETDKERVRSAADRFVTSALGYTGNSEEEYRKGVLDAALAQGLYRSPGGKKIEQYAEAAGEDGITSAAVMDRFEITNTEPNKVEGIAHFRVGKEYNQYAEIEGETTPFTQKLTLSPAYSSYLVSWAEEEKKAENAGSKEEGG